MKIPTLTPSAIDPNEIANLIKIGFCYVKLPTDMVDLTQNCMAVAKEFFLKSKKEKEEFAFDHDIAKKTGIHHGYAWRVQQKQSFPLEQFIINPERPPIGPFASSIASIKRIDKEFIGGIFKPVVQSIYKTLKLPESCFIDSTTNNHRSLVFQYLTPIEKENLSQGVNSETVRFNDHRDFGIGTIVCANEPGLEVKNDGKWWPIEPKKGYAIFNIGNALAEMTDHKCNSAVHHVKNTPGRVSAIFFVAPNFVKPVVNYVNGARIAESGKAFEERQFAEHYR
jgi:isopenicillin N synthase-like dioxygenase